MTAKWDRRFLAHAEHLASWSKDPSTQVGAVIVRPDRSIVAQGYNGLARGVIDTPERLNDRAIKLRITLHAEENAILTAGRHGGAIGCTLYTWPMPPCAHCAAHAIQAGIVRIVAPRPNPSHADRWGLDFALAAEMYREAGLALDLLGGTTHPSPLTEHNL